jgi:hypothetical protein
VNTKLQNALCLGALVVMGGCVAAAKSGHEAGRDVTTADHSPATTQQAAAASRPALQAGGLNVVTGDRNYASDPWALRAAIAGVFAANALLAWLLARRHGYEAGRHRRIFREWAAAKDKWR